MTAERKPGRPRKLKTINDFPADVLTVEETAEVLRVSTDVVYRMVQPPLGCLAAVTIRQGRAIRIPEGKLARILGLVEETTQVVVPYGMEIGPLAGGEELRNVVSLETKRPA